MGLRGFIQGLLPARRYQSKRYPPERFLTSPPLHTDFDLAKFLLEQPDVIRLLERHRIPQASLLTRLSSLPETISDESYEQLRVVLDEARRMEATAELPLAVRTYLLLSAMASPQLRPYITPPGQALGDLPFIVAHRMTEGNARATWGDEAPAARAVEILNDAISPLPCVVYALAESLGMDSTECFVLAMKIHNTGSLRVSPPAGESALAFCVRANRDWRSRGLALYCRPSAGVAGSHAALPLRRAPRAFSNACWGFVLNLQRT